MKKNEMERQMHQVRANEIIKLEGGGAAIRWWKQGDHPMVRPQPQGWMRVGKCPDCGKVGDDHGILQSFRVCPGDWIVEERTETGTKVSIRKDVVKELRQAEAGLAGLDQAEAVCEQAGIGPGPNYQSLLDAAKHGVGAEMDGKRIPPEELLKDRTEPGFEPCHVLNHPKDFEAALRERNAWCNTAAQHLKNEEFYRGLIVKIGEMFGEAAYTSDDGSVQQDVLALKVPELVQMELSVQEANHNEIERLTKDLMKEAQQNIELRKRLDKREDTLKELTQGVHEMDAKIASLEQRVARDNEAPDGFEALKDANRLIVDRWRDLGPDIHPIPTSGLWAEKSAALNELRRIRELVGRVEQRIRRES